ncbi:MAG: hypothetical protein KDD60_01125, partial [Bdellovibrionales bacterium]|nr:hypothetical protein [Bdellovibrionales bacterium]
FTNAQEKSFMPFPVTQQHTPYVQTVPSEIKMPFRRELPDPQPRSPQKGNSYDSSQNAILPKGDTPYSTGADARALNTPISQRAHLEGSISHTPQHMNRRIANGSHQPLTPTQEMQPVAVVIREVFHPILDYNNRRYFNSSDPSEALEVVVFPANEKSPIQFQGQSLAAGSVYLNLQSSPATNGALLKLGEYLGLSAVDTKDPDAMRTTVSSILRGAAAELSTVYQESGLELSYREDISLSTGTIFRLMNSEATSIALYNPEAENQRVLLAMKEEAQRTGRADRVESSTRGRGKSFSNVRNNTAERRRQDHSASKEEFQPSSEEYQRAGISRPNSHEASHFARHLERVLQYGASKEQTNGFLALYGYCPPDQRDSFVSEFVKYLTTPTAGQTHFQVVRDFMFQQAELENAM